MLQYDAWIIDVLIKKANGKNAVLKLSHALILNVVIGETHGRISGIWPFCTGQMMGSQSMQTLCHMLCRRKTRIWGNGPDASVGGSLKIAFNRRRTEGILKAFGKSLKESRR
jgi:hypothetical protein